MYSAHLLTELEMLERCRCQLFDEPVLLLLKQEVCLLVRKKWIRRCCCALATITILLVVVVWCLIYYVSVTLSCTDANSKEYLDRLVRNTC